MKVALVYDRINKWGGAERVLLALHKIFPEAPVFTSVYSPRHAVWAKKFNVKPSFLQQFPHIVTHHELYPYLMPIAFERFSFSGYDLVVSVTSEAAKGIITPIGTHHISYILTPTRYLWSGYEEYFANPAFKMITSPAVSYLKKWDRVASKRPDTLVAISKEVQGRIKKYYERDSVVIYPPADLDVRLKTKDVRRKKSGYFLIVSRLSKFTKYKRIDIAIQACNALQLPLKIVGEGNWRKELEAMAGPTIEFCGSVNDIKLAEYYQNCRALIFPAREDFGLTVVEAQAFGKPVIAFRGGGALETIKEGKTGIFFDQQARDSLIHALKIFEHMHFDPQAGKKNALQFSQSTFQKAFLKLVQKLV